MRLVTDAADLERAIGEECREGMEHLATYLSRYFPEDIREYQRLFGMESSRTWGLIEKLLEELRLRRGGPFRVRNEPPAYY